MENKSDAQLLREYAAQRSEPAFAEIVVRHTDLVYSAACRQTGSPDLAREIAQSVFTDLARKARGLAGSSKPDASLAGWLYRGTRFATLTLLRGERRRQAHERQFMEHFNPSSETAPDWERVAPVLDEAMAELGDADREAVLLRYFKNQDFRAVGLALGVSDAAAQRRVSRAVERLREFFTKRGVTVGAQGLVGVISVNAIQAAPAGLACTLSTVAVLDGTTILTTTTATVGKAIAMTTMQKVLVAVALAAAVGTAIYEARQASRLRDEKQTLLTQQEQLTSERDKALPAAAPSTDNDEQLRREKSELLRLRGEVGMLRNQLSELQKLRAERERSPKQPTPSDPTVPDDETPEWKLAEVRMRFCRVIGLSVLSFANDNRGQMPTNVLAALSAQTQKEFAEKLAQLPPEAANHEIRADQFELVFQGNVMATGRKPGTTIIARAREPVQLSNGRWARPCVFDDSGGLVLVADTLDELAAKEKKLMQPQTP